MALTPQQGWKVTGDFTHTDNKDYWIISTSNDTAGYIFDIESNVFYEPVTIGSEDIGRYTCPITYWRGYSDINFRVDNDWMLGITPVSYTNGATIGVFDYTNIPQLTLTTTFQDGTLTYNLPVILTNTSKALSGHSQTWIKLTNAIYQDIVWTEYSVNQKTVSAMSINDLCLYVSAAGATQSYHPSASLKLVLACPKAKLPADLQIGDDFPGSNFSIDVTSEEYQKAWSQALSNVFPQSNASSVGLNASVNKTLANEANTGAVGSFEISEQQIDTIAGWFHNSFVFQWFSMFALMFVLLFFIKKGMA